MNLAIFDLDNTLLAGDSDFQWGQFLIEKGLLKREEHEARNIEFYEDYKAGRLDIYAFLRFQLKPLADNPRALLDELRQQYLECKVKPMMTDKARALVNRHKANGDLLMIITATNSYVTRPIATEFGIEHLIGTDPEQIDGEFTGNVSGLPSFQEGKVTRLQEWLQARDMKLEDFDTTWFYSDSHNDLPLMRLVKQPVAVDPDDVLRAHAERNGWPIISLR
ncbi:MAG TPA: HAD family hydrolase [Methylophilaceae bacterium]